MCDVQQKYCSPGLSPFSPVTPESGTDSFNTAKSQFSSIHSTSLPLTTNISPDGSSPDLAERYFLPSSNKVSDVFVYAINAEHRFDYLVS